MTRRTMNIIITILVAFIVIFFAGSFAYETYLTRLSDEQSVLTEEQKDQMEKDNQSGNTNEESKNN